QSRQQFRIHALDIARVIIAQHDGLSVLDNLYCALALSFPYAPVNPGKPDCIHSQTLKPFDYSFVHLAAVDHLEDLKRSTIRSSACVARRRSDESWRRAERLRYAVRKMRSAMNENHPHSVARKFSRVFTHCIEIDAFASSDFDYNHKSSSIR